MINAQNKFKNKVLFLVIALIVILTTSFSVAYFSYISNEITGQINFSIVKIKAETNGVFNSNESHYVNIKPGIQILQNDVKFNLDSSNIEEVYIRVKYYFTTTSSNEEVVKVCNDLNNYDLITFENDEYSYIKHEDCYYLADNTKTNLLKVKDVKPLDYIFINSNNAIIPTEMNWDVLSVNEDKISLTIAIEAIQARNVLIDGKSLIESVDIALDSIYN